MAGRDPHPQWWIEVNGDRVYWPEVPHRVRVSFEDVGFCSCGKDRSHPIHDKEAV